MLSWSNVERQVLVRRGGAVNLVLETAGGMRISTLGKSRANGALGDRVEVINLASGKRVNAIVAGRQMARIPF